MQRYQVVFYVVLNFKKKFEAMTDVPHPSTLVPAILFKTLPDIVLSNATETNNSGFVFTRFKWNYVSRKEMIRQYAVNFDVNELIEQGDLILYRNHLKLKV